ncbi:hypothetical protein AN958_03386 [Leucoagaricus sp. SymC.cos]|nr:hypothetical protein AN958_03386 [Leucoagaricus sp. SymC.cos]
MPRAQASNTVVTVQPTHLDIEQVRKILLQHLLYELIDIILVEAQYFVRVTTKRTSSLLAEATYSNRNDARYLYVLSEPIPEISSEDSQRVVSPKVHSVRFSIRSCDQDWSSAADGQSKWVCPQLRFACYIYYLILH